VTTWTRSLNFLCSVLVHGIDLVREPGRHPGAVVHDTFAGIRPGDAAAFMAVQIAGALAAAWLFRWLVPGRAEPVR
jgi:hypothetical protein